ncbi:Neurotransmitter-gated ion-channel transmembrane domain [Trinorchestia longiramus]|nr:Neurotransmitter-gated ion-channel transmembrane domain [Trinorchestia longiramus]
MPNQLLRVYESGDVLYSIRVTLTLSCHLELELYPFDVQKCYVKLSSYSNEASVLKFRWFDERAIVISDEIEIAQFDLISNSTYEHNSFYDTGLFTGNYSGLTVSFTLRRQNGFHLLQTYIPTIMIVFISWVSFWLDPTAIPGRVTLGVTTLLTLTTLSSGARQTLPPVSYVKALDIWLGMCMSMVFGALLEFTFVNYLANKKMINSRLPDLIRIPSCLAGLDEDDPRQGEDEGSNGKTGTTIELVGMQTLPTDEEVRDGVSSIAYRRSGKGSKKASWTPRKKQGEGPTYMFYALVVDRLSRVVFPFSFLLFNLVYWPLFVYMQIIEDEYLKSKRDRFAKSAIEILELSTSTISGKRQHMIFIISSRIHSIFT